MLKGGGRTSQELLHVTDWLPTLVVAAGRFSPQRNNALQIDKGRSYLFKVHSMCCGEREDGYSNLFACHAHCSVPQHLFSIEGKRCISLRQVDDNLIEGEPYNCLSHIHTCIKEKTNTVAQNFILRVKIRELF